MKNFPQRKSLILTVFSAALLSLSIAFFAEAGFLDRGLELTYPDLPGVPTLNSKTTLPELLSYIFTFFVVVGGLIAFGSIVFAGFQFMISGASPQMRSQAMNRIRNVIFGLVLLLSSYIIFNTINPELVLLHTPGIAPKIPKPPEFEAVLGVLDSVDYGTLRYGGVVVFNENYRPPVGDGGTCDDAEKDGIKWYATTGRCEESTTVLHNIGNPDGTGETFDDASYLSESLDTAGTSNGNAKISAIKILGKCQVRLFYDKKGGGSGDKNPADDEAATGSAFLDPGNFYLTSPENDEVMGLAFQVSGTKTDDCLGHSLKVFESKDYNKDSGESTNGSLVFITNQNDLNDRDFVASTKTKKAAKHVRSLRFVFEGNDSRITDGNPGTLPNKALSLNVCNKKGFGGNCVTTSTSTFDIASLTKGWGPGPDMQLSTTTQSIKLDTKEYRQAGVILYENPKLDNGRFEIFIASDANLNPSFVHNDKTSAIVIIGKYRVTLYGDEEFNPNEGWLMIDNTNPGSPWVQTWAEVGDPVDRNKNGLTTDPGETFNANIDEALEGEENEVIALNLGDFCVKYKKDEDKKRTVDAGCEKSFNDMISSIKIELTAEDYSKIFGNPPCLKMFFDATMVDAAAKAGVITTDYCIL